MTGFLAMGDPQVTKTVSVLSHGRLTCMMQGSTPMDFILSPWRCPGSDDSWAKPWEEKAQERFAKCQAGRKVIWTTFSVDIWVWVKLWYGILLEPASILSHVQMGKNGKTCEPWSDHSLSSRGIFEIPLVRWFSQEKTEVSWGTLQLC